MKTSDDSKDDSRVLVGGKSFSWVSDASIEESKLGHKDKLYLNSMANDGKVPQSTMGKNDELTDIRYMILGVGKLGVNSSNDFRWEENQRDCCSRCLAKGSIPGSRHQTGLRLPLLSPLVYQPTNSALTCQISNQFTCHACRMVLESQIGGKFDEA